MRTGLVVFGVIFLVIGGLLYFMPMQEVRASTTTAGVTGTDTRTSSARVTVPIGWAFASAIIGFVLLILGLVAPSPVMGSPVTRRDSTKDSYRKVVESREKMDGDGNSRKTVRQRTQRSSLAEDDDSD